MKPGKKVVAVIPAFNEEKRIGSVLKELGRYVDEVLVSDDGSVDGTAEIARKAGAKVLSSPVNMGVGHATRLGCEYAIEKMGADSIVLIDADGQHPPEEIPKLLAKLEEGYEFVFTNRFGDSRQMPWIKQVGNSVLTHAANFLSGVNITDSQSGFRAFESKAYGKLDMRSDGYDVCSEFVLEVGRKHIKYCEVKIKAVYDEWTEVKGTDITSGIRISMAMLKRGLF